MRHIQAEDGALDYFEQLEEAVKRRKLVGCCFLPQLDTVVFMMNSIRLERSVSSC